MAYAKGWVALMPPKPHSRSASSCTWVLTWFTAACRSFQLKMPPGARSRRRVTNASK